MVDMRLVFCTSKSSCWDSNKDCEHVVGFREDSASSKRFWYTRGTPENVNQGSVPKQEAFWTSCKMFCFCFSLMHHTSVLIAPLPLLAT